MPILNRGPSSSANELLKDDLLGNVLFSFKLIGFLESAGWAAFLIYFPIYLESLGLSNFQIGMIVVAPTIISMFSGIIWGSFSDYLGRRKPFMIQSAIFASIFIFLTTLVSSFEWFLLLGLLKGLLMPVLEGLTVTSLFSLYDRSEMGRVFGSYAMWKSIGWAVSAMIAGALSQLLELRTALYLSSLMFILTFIAALGVPERAGDSSLARSKPLISLGPLKVSFETLRERRILFFLSASLPLYLAINAMMIFLPIYLKASGAAPILVGAIFTIPVFLEAPVFSITGKIADATGGKRILLISSSAAYFLLFMLIGSIRDPLLIFLAYSALDPVSWPPLFTASSALISQVLPPQKWATGQTLYRIWAWSLSPVFGSLIGGWISDVLGMPSMFILMSILSASSCALFTRIKES